MQLFNIAGLEDICCDKDGGPEFTDIVVTTGIATAHLSVSITVVAGYGWLVMCAQ